MTYGTELKPTHTSRIGDYRAKSSWELRCRWWVGSSSARGRFERGCRYSWCSGLVRRRQLSAWSDSCWPTNHRRLWQRSYLRLRGVLIRVNFYDTVRRQRSSSFVFPSICDQRRRREGERGERKEVKERGRKGVLYLIKQVVNESMNDIPLPGCVVPKEYKNTSKKWPTYVKIVVTVVCSKIPVIHVSQTVSMCCTPW